MENDFIKFLQLQEIFRPHQFIKKPTQNFMTVDRLQIFDKMEW